MAARWERAHFRHLFGNLARRELRPLPWPKRLHKTELTPLNSGTLSSGNEKSISRLGSGPAATEKDHTGHFCSGTLMDNTSTRRFSLLKVRPVCSDRFASTFSGS